MHAVLKSRCSFGPILIAHQQWGIRMCLTGILLVILDFFLSLAKLHVGIEREYHVRQRAISTRVFFGIKTDDCSSALETIRL